MLRACKAIDQLLTLKLMDRGEQYMEMHELTFTNQFMKWRAKFLQSNASQLTEMKLTQLEADESFIPIASTLQLLCTKRSHNQHMRREMIMATIRGLLLYEKLRNIWISDLGECLKLMIGLF